MTCQFLQEWLVFELVFYVIRMFWKKWQYSTYVCGLSDSRVLLSPSYGNRAVPTIHHHTNNSLARSRNCLLCSHDQWAHAKFVSCPWNGILGYNPKRWGVKILEIGLADMCVQKRQVLGIKRWHSRTCALTTQRASRYCERPAASVRCGLDMRCHEYLHNPALHAKASGQTTKFGTDHQLVSGTHKEDPLLKMWLREARPMDV